MNIKICENGHYYNGNRYKCCPYCEEQQMVSQGKLKTEKQGNVVEEEHVDIQQEVQQAESNKAIKAKKAEKKKYSEKEIRKDYAKLTKLLIEWNMSITTMESATAGQIASLITDTEGASAIFKGASITYSNETKIMQGVSAEVIHKYTVYSKETAEAMATACANMYGADIGIGVTGTMGNTDPDNADASVPGQVYFAISMKGSVRSYVVEIPQQPSRLMYKLAVAKEVYDVLMRLFE
ncbi:MAG: CinA family protein [Wujia sp.]|nr:CinA family protein [Wujia sp.]MCI6240419.1 CinA family protein [Clostridium sp.]MDD7284121.1 CinA family protein [Clostridium sp.]MDY3727747.1 CinA family protein [Wujia sp.]